MPRNQAGSCVRAGYDPNKVSSAAVTQTRRHPAATRIGPVQRVARTSFSCKRGMPSPVASVKARRDETPPPSVRPRPLPTGSSVRQAGALPRAPRQTRASSVSRRTDCTKINNIRRTPWYPVIRHRGDRWHRQASPPLPGASGADNYPPPLAAPRHLPRQVSQESRTRSARPGSGCAPDRQRRGVLSGGRQSQDASRHWRSTEGRSICRRRRSSSRRRPRRC
jgi:hypothetical protein